MNNLASDLLYYNIEEKTPYYKPPSFSEGRQYIAIQTIEKLYKQSDDDELLNEILKDFDEIEEYAAEEGFEPPSIKVKARTEEMLKTIYRILPVRYIIYPLEGKNLAIEVTVKHGRGILIIFEDDGGVVCFVSMDGNNRRARYDIADHFPKGFIYEALRELRQD